MRGTINSWLNGQVFAVMSLITCDDFTQIICRDSIRAYPQNKKRKITFLSVKPLTYFGRYRTSKSNRSVLSSHCLFSGGMLLLCRPVVLFLDSQSYCSCIPTDQTPSDGTHHISD